MGNLNLGTLECEECGNSFSCRIGLSNRQDQPFSITCKECGSSLSLELSKDGTIKRSGLKDSNKKAEYHVDLHLDFPVFEHEEHPIISPFIMSAIIAGDSNIGQHAHNMHKLNNISHDLVSIKNAFTFYSKGNHKSFSRKANDFLEISSTVTNDIQAEILLFKYLFELIEPFSELTLTNAAIDDFTNTIKSLSQNKSTELDVFTKELLNTRFIKISINDTIKIYKQILQREIIFRPSLFLDFDPSYVNKKVPYKLSTKDFEYISDLFKDISETISRQLVVVAGVNNIIKRGDHNLFNPVISNANKHLEPKSLKEYSDFDFGKKLDHIDSSWFVISKDIADNQLRNSTAHFKWEYDSITQEITYYPKKEGLERIANSQIYLIDYCKKIIDSFRVMHKLNYLSHLLNLKAHKII